MVGSGMGTMARSVGDKLSCIYCGHHVSAHFKQCPFFREAFPQVKLSRRTGPDGHQHIRRGLLYMLLAGVIHYFAAGYADPFKIPLPAPALPLVTQYLTPLLFLGGLGMTLYGLYLKFRS